MGTVRNSINVEGIAKETDFPDKNNGQLIKYSDSETLFIPSDKSGAKTIYEISIDLNINNDRVVNGPDGKIVVLDGSKSIKVIYTENSTDEKVNIIDIKIPFNTFFEVPFETKDILDVNVFIIDAYFQLIDQRKIYSHFVYLIDVHFDKKYVKPYSNKKKDDDFILLDESLLENYFFNDIPFI